MATEKEPFLYSHQREAVDKIKNGCILYGGVGSGKSRTGLYYYFKENGGSINPDYKPMKKTPQDLFIITTAQKRDKLEWEGEMANFHITMNKEIARYQHTVVVDSWNNIQKYKAIRNAFFIFDEDRVTGKGAWVKAFYKIAANNNWIILSATPGDTWEQYIPVFVANGFYRNKTEFCEQHCIYSRYTKYPQIERYIDTYRLTRLRDRILIDMDFARSTVAHHEDIYCSYDIPKYKDVFRNRWDPYKNEPIQQAAGLCYVLRRVVNASDDRIVKLMEILEKTDRAIIFYNFDYELDMLRHLFFDYEDYDDLLDVESHYGYDVAEWNGHMHQEIPDSNKWVYLVQYTAGCEGWNCIKTDTVIFFSQNYSYKVVAQAAGRIDRLNTPYVDLYYYHLKSRSGIDLAISKALREKKRFNESRWVNRR